MTNTAGESRHFKTSDGVKLHYLEAGSGSALVLVPGWSQSAEQFKYQLEGLSDRYHCIAVDMRGHARSNSANTASIPASALPLGSSGRALRKVTRIPRRVRSVPGACSPGPPATAPSDPVARPGRDRSLAVGQPR